MGVALALPGAHGDHHALRLAWAHVRRARDAPVADAVAPARACEPVDHLLIRSEERRELGDEHLFPVFLPLFGEQKPLRRGGPPRHRPPRCEKSYALNTRH